MCESVKKLELSTRPVLTVLLTLVFGVISFVMPVVQADLGDPNFSTLQFRNRWVEQDRLVGAAGIGRPYTWGPAVGGSEGIQTEAYKESPGGQRQVQYFDKGRMEINQPFAGGAVTTGLLVRELVSGKRQDGDNTFVNLPPSQTQVAGDDVSINPNTPVYASFQNLITFGTPDANSRPASPGSTLNQLIDKSGQVSSFSPPQALNVGPYQPETGHNIAQVFEDFKNLRGPTTDPLTGNRLENQPVYTANPTVNVFGYAVTEPYWVRTKIGGTDQVVLVQLFQRRVLTYNPTLSGQKVEMGNLGQHYYKWRYTENVGKGNPATSAGDVECLPATTTDLAVQACLSDNEPASGSDVTLYGRLDRQ